MPRYYWDACVFVAWLNGEPERCPNIEASLERAEKQEVAVITSTLSVVEVAYTTEEALGGGLTDAVIDAIEDLWAPGSVIKRVELHILIAEQARDLIRQAKAKGRGLRSADATHLATAMSISADEIHTYENEATRSLWHDLTGILVREPPPTSTPRLGL
jgi:predicted nucleic acid-binding protein